MSGFQHREGSGSMLANNKAADNHPDWRGDFMLNGTLYEIAGWAGTTQGGRGRISLKVQAARDRQAAAPQPAQPQPSRNDSDEIPF